MKCSILSLVAILAIGCNAATVAQYDGFKDTNCTTPSGNSIIAVDSIAVGGCTQIHDFSVNLVLINTGCTMHLFDDTMCTSNNRTVLANTCVDNRGAPFEGYTIECPYGTVNRK